jgi:hypothetical protein
MISQRRGDMPVIYYKPKENESTERLQNIIETEAQKERVEVYHSMEELLARLNQPNWGNNIVLLFVNDMEEFYQILPMKRLLIDTRIIIVLPERSEKALSAAYKIYPRFISYQDSDFNDVAVVLRRMINLAGKKIPVF